MTVDDDESNEENDVVKTLDLSQYRIPKTTP